ncbi:MAG: Rid family detoxifying hydrolase [Bacteroidota bacterium]
MRKNISISGAPKPLGPYSQAVMIKGMCFISGQVAINPHTGEFVGATAAEQAEQAMENVKALLFEAGLDFSNVVKTSIFLMDMNDFDAVNAVYQGYFQENYPARETVQVSRLPKNALVEISAIAVE